MHRKLLNISGKWYWKSLSEAEEKQIIKEANLEQERILRDCFETAKKIQEDFPEYTTEQIALALFKVRASHTIYAIENEIIKKFGAT